MLCIVMMLACSCRRQDIDTDTGVDTNADTSTDTIIDTNAGTDTEIDSSEHICVPVELEKKEPTCTEVGYSSGSKCSICNKILIEQDEIPPVRHDILKTVVPPNEILGFGYTEYTCFNCDYVLQEDFIYLPDKSSLFTFVSLENNTCKITAINDNSETHIIIPEKNDNGETIVEIGDSAFSKNTTVKYVVIPDTVTKIGGQAFYCCSALETVILPNNTVFFGNMAFYCCTSLVNIDMSNTKANNLSNQLFYGCKALKSAKLTGVTKIPNFAFANCSNLTSVIFDEPVTEVGERAFENCSSLTEFRYDKSENNFDTVEVFMPNAFWNCTGLKTIVFGSCLRAINSDAFDGCRGLDLVDMSKTSSTGYGDFSNCSIREFIPSPNATIIGPSAFYNSNLGEFYLSDNITEIRSRAFCNASFDTIHFGTNVQKIGTEAFYGAKGNYDLSRVTAPLTVEYLAFANSTMTSFYFPESTVYIENSALAGCNNLKVLSIPFIGKDSNTSNGSTDCFAHLFGRDIDCWDQELVVPKSIETVIITGSEDIGSADFAGVFYVKNLVISNKIKNIGAENFNNGSQLKNVFYHGTEEEYGQLYVASKNQAFNNATKYFYSENEPKDDGYYFHYVDGVPVIW